ncbi:MAG TPA: YraN family protein [Rhodanobacteraceae bacterium]|nr:YraN family protein [Rhodanobacteraceae bacterium]
MSTAGIGAHFEHAALRQLERAGLTRVDSNFRTRFGEIDLVMRDRDTLVFVEVRYRRDPRFGGGAASVGAAKQRRLTRAAQGFLATRPELARLPCRFDVVAFDGDADAPRCDWRRNAFDAS